MSEKNKLFRRTLFGYHKRQVEKFISDCVNERSVMEQGYLGRIELLMRRCELAEEDMRQQQKQNEDLRRRLEENRMETEALARSLSQVKAQLAQTENATTAQKKQDEEEKMLWRQRAETAEDALKKITLEKLNSEVENDRHFQLPMGKNRVLDLCLKKKERSES